MLTLLSKPLTESLFLLLLLCDVVCAACARVIELLWIIFQPHRLSPLLTRLLALLNPPLSSSNNFPSDLFSLPPYRQMMMVHDERPRRVYENLSILSIGQERCFLTLSYFLTKSQMKKKEREKSEMKRDYHMEGGQEMHNKTTTTHKHSLNRLCTLVNQKKKAKKKSLKRKKNEGDRKRKKNMK